MKIRVRIRPVLKRLQDKKTKRCEKKYSRGGAGLTRQRYCTKNKMALIGRNKCLKARRNHKLWGYIYKRSDYRPIL